MEHQATVVPEPAFRSRMQSNYHNVVYKICFYSSVRLSTATQGFGATGSLGEEHCLPI